MASARSMASPRSEDAAARGEAEYAENSQRRPSQQHALEATVQGPKSAAAPAPEQIDRQVEDQQAKDESEEDMRANDPACLLCDDGGNVMSCDGNCMRSFHIGMLDADSYSPEACNPMEMPGDLAKRLNGSNDPFMCPNCVSSCHQCFKCGKEGSTNTHKGSFVKRCSVFECGRFYHPRCISKNSHDIFICPLHVCAAVAEGKCKNDNSEGPIIECRRCPIAYHKDCIPLNLWLTRSGSSAAQRVWLAQPEDSQDDPDVEETYDPVDRSLIYCMNHAIEPGAEVPEHTQPLFSQALLSSWALHYARRFPELESSAGLLAALNAWPQQSREGRDGAESISLNTQIAASSSGGGAGAGEDTDPSLRAVKRRKLVRLRRQDEGSSVQEDVTARAQIKTQANGGDKSIHSAAEEEYKTETLNGNETPLVAPIEDQIEEEAEEEEEADDDSEGSLFDFEKESYWTDDAIFSRQTRLTEQCKNDITLDVIRHKTRMPEPYAMPFKKTITEDRLEGILQAFRLAQARPEDKDLHVTFRLLREVKQHEDNLRTSLACYLHNDRYSSYGRHFTKVDLLRYVAKKLEVLVNPGDTLVDFSCGSNEFLPILKRHCLSQGKAVDGCAFDIITPCNAEDFRQMSWFEVTPGKVLCITIPAQEENGVSAEDIGAHPDQMVIGLNPPYGMNNALAIKFQDHAAMFRPRIIVLIVPPGTPIPQGYVIVLEDRTTMADKSFYIPGLAEAKMEQWNKVTPAFRILARHDCYPLSDRLHAHHLGPVARAYKFPVMQRPVYFDHPVPIAPIMPMGQLPPPYPYMYGHPR